MTGTTPTASAPATGAAPTGDATPTTGRWRIVGLIAGREIATRLRSKAFRIATIATVVLLAGLALVTKFAGGGADFTVGVTPGTAALAAPLRASATSLDQKITIRTVTDDASGRAAVRDGKLDALLVGDGSTVDVVVDHELKPELANTVHVLAGQLAFGREIVSLGGDPATAAGAIGDAPVAVTSLEPPHPYQTQRLVLGIIAGILIYLSLMIGGQAVAQGVVEEKTSRIVELLLSTVRPWQLMAGKVAGIGAVGLIQIAVIGAAGVAVGLGTGSLSLPASAAGSTVAWLVVWYLLGFFAYALAFAAVAALVSRQEDVAGVVTPVLMFLIVGYVLGISILPADPGNRLIEVLSLIPVFAPTLMPMRLAIGGVPVWQAVTAVAAMVAMIPLLVWLSARIYRNAVMRAGARVRLRDVWRAP